MNSGYRRDNLGLSISLFLLVIPILFEFTIILFFNSYLFISIFFISFYVICILIWIFQSYFNKLKNFPLVKFNDNEEKILEEEYILNYPVKMKIIITNKGIYINDVYSINKTNKYFFYGWNKLESISPIYEYKRILFTSSSYFSINFKKDYSSFFWDRFYICSIH